MTVADDLRAAKELISDPKRWTQGTFARNRDGSAVDEASPSAVCWCAWGAISAVAQNPENRREAVITYLHLAATSLGHASAPQLNDMCDHVAVMRMFDRAITEAERDVV